MKTKILFALIAAFTLFGITSCKTVPEIPEDMTAAQLLQEGQRYTNLLNYSAAESYYMAVITRYGSNGALYVEGRYELGCVYMKQKKYDKARTAFEEILSMYDEAAIGELPPAFEKLAKLKLDQIPEKKK